MNVSAGFILFSVTSTIQCIVQCGAPCHLLQLAFEPPTRMGQPSEISDNRQHPRHRTRYGIPHKPPVTQLKRHGLRPGRHSAAARSTPHVGHPRPTATLCVTLQSPDPDATHPHRQYWTHPGSAARSTAPSSRHTSSAGISGGSGYVAIPGCVSNSCGYPWTCQQHLWLSRLSLDVSTAAVAITLPGCFSNLQLQLSRLSLDVHLWVKKALPLGEAGVATPSSARPAWCASWRWRPPRPSAASSARHAARWTASR